MDLLTSEFKPRASLGCRVPVGFACDPAGRRAWTPLFEKLAARGFECSWLPGRLESQTGGCVLVSGDRELVLCDGPLLGETEDALAHAAGSVRSFAVQGEHDRRKVAGKGLEAIVAGPLIAPGWAGGATAMPVGRTVLVEADSVSPGRLAMLLRLQRHAGDLGVPIVWRVPEPAARALNVRAERSGFVSLLSRCRAVVCTPGAWAYDAMRAGRGVAVFDERARDALCAECWWGGSPWDTGDCEDPVVFDRSLRREHSDPTSMLDAILALDIESRRRQGGVLRLSTDTRVDGVKELATWVLAGRSIVEPKSGSKLGDQPVPKPEPARAMMF